MIKLNLRSCCIASASAAAVAAEPGNLFLLHSITAVNKQISAGANTETLGGTDGARAAPASAFQTVWNRIEIHRGAPTVFGFFFKHTHHYCDILKVAPWESAVFCSCFLCHPLCCHHRHIAYGARSCRFKPSAFEAHNKLKSAGSAVLLSPSSPPSPARSSSLFHGAYNLSNFLPCLAQTSRCNPRVILHINDWRLTHNGPLMIDQCRISPGAEPFIGGGCWKKVGSPHPLPSINANLNEAWGGENLPSGAVEEHNSLWPCHEGAHLHTCRQEDRGLELVTPHELFLTCFYFVMWSEEL